MTGKPDAMSTWDGVLDLNEQDVLKEDCRFQAGVLLIASFTLLFLNSSLSFDAY